MALPMTQGTLYKQTKMYSPKGIHMQYHVKTLLFLEFYKKILKFRYF